MKIVICRRDLPVNPGWKEKNYPFPYCWEPYELFSKAVSEGGRLYDEARRIWWEAYWRWYGRYKGKHPFFDVWVVEDGRLHDVSESSKVVRQVLSEILISGWTVPGFVPEEVKRTTIRIYREVLRSVKQVVWSLKRLLPF